jgi:hypothetical protein
MAPLEGEGIFMTTTYQKQTRRAQQKRGRGLFYYHYHNQGEEQDRTLFWYRLGPRDALRPFLAQLDTEASLGEGVFMNEI